MTNLESTPSFSQNQYIVYVFSVSSGPIKIGMTNDVERRLTSIQTGNHELVSVACLFTCETSEDAGIIERALHRRYAEKRIRGEWFNVDPQDVVEDIEFASRVAPLITNIQVHQIEAPTPPERTVTITSDTAIREGGKVVGHTCPGCGKELSVSGWSRHKKSCEELIEIGG